MDIGVGRGVAPAILSLATHDLLGRRKRFDIGRSRENAFSVLLDRSGVLRKFDAVVVEAPQQGGNRHVEHGKLFAKHELVLEQQGSQLREAVANVLARVFKNFFVWCGTVLECRHVYEKLFLEVVQEQAGTGTHHGVGGHQLRMRKTLVDVFVDDVRFVQNQVTLDKDGNLTIGVHDADVFRLVVEIDVADLKIHSFLEQHKAAALRKRAGRSRVENHHVEASHPKKYVSITMLGKMK